MCVASLKIIDISSVQKITKDKRTVTLGTGIRYSLRAQKCAEDNQTR